MTHPTQQNKGEEAKYPYRCSNCHEIVDINKGLYGHTCPAPHHERKEWVSHFYEVDNVGVMIKETGGSWFLIISGSKEVVIGISDLFHLAQQEKVREIREYAESRIKILGQSYDVERAVKELRLRAGGVVGADYVYGMAQGLYDALCNPSLQLEDKNKR